MPLPDCSPRQPSNGFYSCSLETITLITNYKHQNTLRGIAAQGKSSYDWSMDDNSFECPHCGARVYPEMTRCPQCGRNMYPEDEAEVAPDRTSEAPRWVSSLGAVMIGWIVAAGITFIIHSIVAIFVPSADLSWPGSIVLFFAGPLGAFIGGYLCAVISRHNPKLLGGTIGILTLPVLVLMTTHWYEVTIDMIRSPTVLVAAMLTILAGVGGGWLNGILAAGGDWREKWRMRGWEDLLYQELLRKVRFNGSIADRLIEYERQQDPDASRLKLIQNAIERWERDNR